MKWVRDRTGLFEWRPYYTQEEIDIHCENVMSKFQRDQGRAGEYPISTDDLAVLIERDVSDLDLYAELFPEGADVEGVTVFRKKGKPSVRILRQLSEDPSRENRLRTTLTHEYGHVIFHNFVWRLDRYGKPLPSLHRSPRCRRDRMQSAPQSDWLEWQAGYAGAALLMPFTAVKRLVRTEWVRRGVSGAVRSGTKDYREVVSSVSETFGVSGDAAKYRLQKLGLVSAAAGKRTARA
jgi:hypothetical protein